MASADKPLRFTETQWAAVDRWCFSYKKSTDIFVRWVCRTSGCAPLTHDNSQETLVGLATVSRGVNNIVTRGISPPNHVRRALERAIQLRSQVTNFYKEVEIVETVSTKGHVAFTDQLAAFQEALKKVPSLPKYVHKEKISRIVSKGAYGVLEEVQGSDNDEDSEGFTAAAQALAVKNFSKEVETQLVSLNNDTLLEDMMVRSGALLLIFLATAANDTFKVKRLDPKALCEGAWIASAASYLARGICFDLLAKTGLSLKDFIIKIQKPLLDHETKALELLPLHTVVAGILHTLNDALKVHTVTVTKLSPNQAAEFEAFLSKEDLQMNQMLEIAKQIFSNVRSWCIFMAERENSLYDWVPHIPLARIIMNHMWESKESNMFHAAMETIIVLQTSAVSTQASGQHLLSTLRRPHLDSSKW